MDTFSLVLVLVGSVFHVTWNILAKGARDRLAFMWLALVPPAVIGLGVWVHALFVAPVDPTILGCALASGALNAVYFGLLAFAYGRSDFSLVYPYSRGVGSLMATAGSILFFGDTPSRLGGIGIALAIGATGLEATAHARREGGLRTTVALGPTLLTGVVIGGYLLVDKWGVRRGNPVTYLMAIYTPAMLFLAPVVLRGGRAAAELRHSGWRSPVAALLLAASYGVVLVAMHRAPLSYVVAARAFGVAVSGIAGYVLFRERIDGVRRVAMVLITAGVICIGLSR